MPAPIKFARLEYVKNQSEIPVRYNVIKQNPELQMRWYIDKYNPLAVSECVVAGEVGLKVLLPLTQNEALADVERAKTIILNAINKLRSEGIEIVMPPENVELINAIATHIADGRHLLPFVLCHALRKWEEQMKRPLHRCEAVVVNKTLEQTECILNHICNDLNFVTVLDMHDDREMLLNIADKIFDDTGLNVVIRSMNKAALRTADIVVLTTSDEFDTAYKRNALVFDLTSNNKRRSELAARRLDVFVVDSLLLSHKNNKIKLQLFEMALYAKNHSFRQIVANGYDEENGEDVRRYIKRLGLGVVSLLQNNKVFQ